MLDVLNLCFGRGAKILTYHGVTGKDAGEGMLSSLRVPAARFAEHIALLRKHWRVVRLGDLISGLAEGKAPDERTVVITFDDGYANNYTEAFDVLKRFEVPATIFLTAGLIGTSELLWHDRLERAIRTATVDVVEVFGTSYALSSPEERAQGFSALLKRFKGLADSDMRKALVHVESQTRPSGPMSDPDTRLLTWPEVITMAESGLVEFGAHSMRHSILTRIEGPALADDLVQARQTIEKNTNKECVLLCYPNGQKSDYSARVIELAKGAGYLAACTTVRGLCRVGVPPFELPRFSVSGARSGTEELHLTLSGLRS